jgi:Ricin-type beta-trefoil lectin domain
MRQVPRFPNGDTCEWEVFGDYPYADWGGSAQSALMYCDATGKNLVRRNPDKVRDYKCTDFPSLKKVVLSIYVCSEDKNGNFLGTWWINTNSGMVFEVGHSNTSDGATVDQWPFNGTDTQYWLPVHYDDTYDALVNVNSGKCLGVGGGSTSWQAPVVLWTCNGNPDQKWTFSYTGGSASNGNPVYNLIDQNSGLCLDVPNSSTSQGTALWQYGCNGTSAQGWF